MSACGWLARWLAAPALGTVASAWREAGKVDPQTPQVFAFDNHWYRLVLCEKGPFKLRLHGLATLSEVWLHNTKSPDSDSMFVAHDLDLHLDDHAAFYLCFRSLSAALRSSLDGNGGSTCLQRCINNAAMARYANVFPLARDAGMNLLRVGGTMLHESDAIYGLADEYGPLAWQLQNLRRGASPGVIDALGTSKSAWHGLVPVSLPIAALITDEGLDGLAVHSINETAAPIHTRPELACLRDGTMKVTKCVDGRHTRRTQHGAYPGLSPALPVLRLPLRVESRSAPNATVITVRDKLSGDVLSEAFHEVRVKQTSSQNWAPVAGAKRLTRCVHIVDPRYRATLDWLQLSPGHERRIPLVGRQHNTAHPPESEVRALNATFSIHCQRDRKAMRTKTRRVPSGRTSVSSGAAKQMRSLAHQVDGTVLNQF